MSVSLNYLTGSKKRLYQIFAAFTEGKNLLDDYEKEGFVCSYSSPGGAFKSKDAYVNFLSKMIEGVSYICTYLKNEKTPGLDHAKLNGILDKVSTLATNVKGTIDDLKTKENFDEGVMKDFIVKLNNHFTIIQNKIQVLSDHFMICQIFKQIYTLIYGFIMNYNPYSRTTKGRLKTFESKTNSIKKGAHLDKIPTGDIFEKNFTKSDQVYEWISGKMNWTLVICCIDKVVFCYDADKQFFIPEEIINKLPYIRFMATKLKCSPESFISGLEYAIKDTDDNIFYRTSKKIRNDNGLTIDLRITNKIYNFKNLVIASKNSATYFFYVVLLNDIVQDPAQMADTYKYVAPEPPKSGMVLENNETG